MDDNFAPYAPKTAVTETITRYRDRGLPVPVTPQALEAVGVATTMAPRTLQTLQFLGLLDGENNPTELFQRLKRASTDEYQGLLAEVVRGAYIRVFEIVDPATDGDVAIGDAFRVFEPSKQRVKMISLFRGLCAEAGIMEQSRSRPAVRRPRVNGTKPARKAQNASDSTSGESTAPPAPPAREDGDVLSQDAMRSMYFKLLLKKAEAGDGGDADLFGRIERLVGLQSADEGEDRGWNRRVQTASNHPASQEEG
jgi:Family of unknown function (DUF5343)